MACIMAGMAIGATMELAIAHWRDADRTIPSAKSIDDERPAEAAAVPVALDIPAASKPVVSTRPYASTAGANEPDVARQQGICTDPSVRDMATAFLNPNCGSNKPHARHIARTTYRVATVVIGHTDATAAETAPVAMAAIEPLHAPASVMLRMVPAPTQPAERAAPPKKVKVVASAPIALTLPTREPTQQDAGFNAFAGTPWPGRSDTSRAADLQSLGGPFGRIW
jgi:hypothetical protein